MDKAERQYLQALIESRIHQLETLLKVKDCSMYQKAPEKEDDDVQMNSVVVSAIEQRVVEDTKVELNRLNENLEWLQSDEAGLCESCGCVIASARLKALLVTRLCVACAQQQEGDR